MKSINSLLVTVTTILAVTTCTATDNSKTVVEYKTATGFFQRYDGCLYTLIILEFTDQLTHNPDGSTTSVRYFGYFSRVEDVCDDYRTLSQILVINSTNCQFEVANDLSNASGSGVAVGYDNVNHENVTVTLNLAWTATDPELFHGFYKASDDSEGTRTDVKYIGKGRHVVATGTISTTGSSIIPDGTNLTPDPSSDDFLTQTKNTTVTRTQ